MQNIVKETSVVKCQWFFIHIRNQIWRHCDLPGTYRGVLYSSQIHKVVYACYFM